MKTACILAASISSYIDGELPAEDIERIRLHLKTCATCRDQFQILSAMNEKIAAMPIINPSPDFDRIFWQKIETLEEKRRRPAWKQWINGDRLRDWRPALAAAAGVLILCGTIMFNHQPAETGFSADEIVISRNLELLTDYEIISYLDFLEHWTEFAEIEATDA